MKSHRKDIPFFTLFHTGEKKTSHERQYKSDRLPPWKSSFWLFLLCVSLLLSSWLTLHMPAGRMPGREGRTSLSTVKEQKEVHPQVWQEQQSRITNIKEKEEDGTIVKKQNDRDPSPVNALFTRIQTFLRLFLLVGIASFLGGVMETRRWYLMLRPVTGWLARRARLPEAVGIAMPIALYSNPTANALLVSSHSEGKITASSLVAGGMVNSYLAYLSHSMRVMYPVVALVGFPALVYFAIQFSGGALLIVGVLLWNCHRNPSATMSLPAGQSKSPQEERTALPWSVAIRVGCIRAASLLFRLLCIAVPLMLSIEWLLKTDTFSFWEQSVPAWVHRLFPVELISVVVAQLGGLVQSATVAAGLRAEGLINNTQILLAMLVGSAVSNPVRTLRRNLPTALAIFPPRLGLIIVLSMQCARFLMTLLAAASVVWWTHVSA